MNFFEKVNIIKEIIINFQRVIEALYYFIFENIISCLLNPLVKFSDNINVSLK